MLRQSTVPDVITRNALISSCGGKEALRALEMFHAMAWRGVAPDVITYTALINACEKGEQF